MKISFILPCFNEEQNVQTYPKELLPYLEKYDYELIMVDDCSSDNTYKELLKLKNSKTTILQHEKNGGMGAAIKTGINDAKGDIIITLDADLTFHPKYIEKLVTAYESHKTDAVLGSHILGELSEDIPLFRKIISKISNIVYSIILGKKVTAITPVFRLYRSSALKEIYIKSNDFNINAEILFKLIQNKKTFVEVPVRLGTRIYGESKLNYKKEIFNHLKLVFIILLWRLKRFIRFTVSSGLGVLVNILITVVLTEFFFTRKNFFYAYIIGLTIGLLIQYIMHIIYTFKKKYFSLKRLIIFYLYSIIITVLQASLVKTISNFIGVDYYLIIIISIIGIFYCINYFILSRLIFK